MPLSWERTSTWTLASHAWSWVARPGSREEVYEVLAEARQRRLSVTPRGAGLSYGDEILNASGIVLDLSRMNRILKWNPATGHLTVEPGATFEQALRCCLPDNWVIPAVPGIRHPTLGGALANNVHGKNAWKDGTLGDWVVSFTLLAGDGRLYTCSREENPDLFQAAIAGVGLLGVFVEIVLQCKRIPSPHLEVRKWTVPDFDRLLEDMEGQRPATDYHIAWVDCFATGRAFGRGTIHAARFVEAPRRAARAEPLGFTSPFFLAVVPRTWVWPVLRPFFGNTFVRVVNAAKFHADRLTTSHRPYTQNFFAFTFLLDSIPDWRQLYAPHGYVELEPVIPFETFAGAFREIWELTRRYGCPSYMCGVKSHRRDDFLLSCSVDGYSFGVDIPIEPGREAELDRLFRAMNEVVLRAGGKTYFAKNDKLTVDQFRRMFPRWSEFEALKRRVDPEALFQSDMYRRLFAGGGPAEGRP